jgi:hypothetical protein
MRISALTPVASVQSNVGPAATAPSFRSPASGEVAFMDLPGAGFLSLRDTLTGYGRPGGYDSLANARRASYMLSVGAASPAAGIFQQGERFYVRALGGLVAKDPHGEADAPGAPAPALQLLHFEGNAAAHFGWVRDSRLVMVVDGATKVWSKDAHHKPPTA